MIEDEGLEESEFDDIKTALKGAFQAGRAAAAAHLDSRRAMLNGLSEDEKAHLDAIR